MNLQKLVTVTLAIFVTQMAAETAPALLAAQDNAFVTSERLTLGMDSNRSASIRLGDLDSDGDLDAVVANGRHWPQQNFVFFNQGKLRFSVMRPLGMDRGTTYACELADLDGDGDLDVAIGNDMALGQIFLNDGKGAFKEHEPFGEVASVRSLTVADIDNDGDVDILATCRGMPNRIYLNDGKASFESGPSFGTKADSTINVAVGDVNGDGHQDLLLANRDSQQNCLLLNNGKLEFNDRRLFGSGKDQSRAIATGDLNGDGKLDWVTGNIGQSNLVCLGDGTGGVLSSIEFGKAENRTYSIAVADLDADGDADIVTGNAGQSNCAFLNGGDAKAFRQITFGGSNATYGLCIGDLSGDGLPDIAVANSDAMNFVFLNRLKKRKTLTGGKAISKPSVETQDRDKPSASQTSKDFRQRRVYQSTNWPSFRGTGARGVAEGFPVRTSWNAGRNEGKDSNAVDNVLWQIEVPGLGHSSPVIFGDKVFLITAVARNGQAPLQVESGGKPTAADDNGEQDWLVLCYDKTSGKELWRKTAQQGKPRATRHAKATHANTSVSVDGENVLAFLGSEGLHCFDMDGNLKWSRDLGVINISKYGIGWGFASSPAVHKDRIAIVCDDPENPFVAVLRLSDGTEVWRNSRKDICERSWGTPLIHSGVDATQIVVNGWPWILSYDLQSGKELWRIKGGGDNPIPSPFEAHGNIFVTNAHGGPAPIFVVRPNARGDLSSEITDEKSDSPKTNQDSSNNKSESIVWSVEKGGSYMSTPVVYGDYIYLGNSNGVVRCFHALTGAKIYEKRLDRGAGIIASLIASDGKVFCASENGNVYVLQAGPEFKVLATNPMSEPCLASPAISSGVLFFRTTKRLIAIQ